MVEIERSQPGQAAATQRFTGWSDAELRAHASDLGIVAAARMNRDQLIEAIRDRQARAWARD